MLEWAGDSRDFEFQRLHGMGEGLYERLVREQGYHTRIYAPVGGHRDLLAYLVRRLLENGANSCFVHQLADETADRRATSSPIRSRRSPRSAARAIPRIPLPEDLFAPERAQQRGHRPQRPARAGAGRRGGRAAARLQAATAAARSGRRGGRRARCAAFPAWSARSVEERAAVPRAARRPARATTATR